MNAHNYHPSCGCYSCGHAEEARESDEELANSYKDDLRKLPRLLEEVVLSDEDNARAAAALAGDDAIEFARIWREARDWYVDEIVEAKAEEVGLGLAEAAERMLRVFS